MQSQITMAEYEQHTLPCTGELPVTFSGTLLGTGEIRGRYWTKVQIYRTERGAFVGHVLQGSDDPENQGRAKVKTADTLPALIVELRDRKGQLGGATLQALTEAAQNDPEIRAQLARRID